MFIGIRNTENIPNMVYVQRRKRIDRVLIIYKGIKRVSHGRTSGCPVDTGTKRLWDKTSTDKTSIGQSVFGTTRLLEQNV